MVNVWEGTGLHRAWERGVQQQAIEQAQDLFKDAEQPDEWAPTIEIDDPTGQAQGKPIPTQMACCWTIVGHRVTGRTEMQTMNWQRLQTDFSRGWDCLPV
mmetsp:Transcript_5121/g.10445  ORF Transcript_5121/g.10445 Transcript_5121/m.10445 type:complete len:100 (-) Transcript_5121:225-524(-)